MKILVAYGTKRGATQGLSQMLANALVDEGAQVVVEPADAVRDLEGVDAVIVGGSLYMGRWHHDAVRLVKRLTQQLKERPVWLFSSGPIGEGADEQHDLPPLDKVAALMDRVGARGHVTFGGALDADASGLIASKMAATMAGDWRDPEEVAAWASEIAGELQIASRN